jgi:hypothetical protein
MRIRGPACQAVWNSPRRGYDVTDGPDIACPSLVVTTEPDYGAIYEFIACTLEGRQPPALGDRGVWMDAPNAIGPRPAIWQGY